MNVSYSIIVSFTLPDEELDAETFEMNHDDFRRKQTNESYVSYQKDYLGHDLPSGLDIFGGAGYDKH